MNAILSRSFAKKTVEIWSLSISPCVSQCFNFLSFKSIGWKINSIKFQHELEPKSFIPASLSFSVYHLLLYVCTIRIKKLLNVKIFMTRKNVNDKTSCFGAICKHIWTSLVVPLKLKWRFKRIYVFGVFFLIKSDNLFDFLKKHRRKSLKNLLNNKICFFSF